MRAWEFMEDWAAIGVNESGTIKPVAPLTSEQAQRKAKRQAAMAEKMRDEDARHAEKVRDLRSKIAGQ